MLLFWKWYVYLGNEVLSSKLHFEEYGINNNYAKQNNDASRAMKYICKIYDSERFSIWQTEQQLEVFNHDYINFDYKL